MKILLAIYLWFIGFLYIGVVSIIALILTFIVPQRKLEPLIKAGLRFLFRLLHTGVIVEGKEKIDADQTYIFMANHVSLFDVPLMGGFIPNFFRGVEAKHHFNWPIYGWFIRRLGNIPIDRKNIRTSIRSMRHAAEYIKQGTSIAIMPEGHRTLDGQLRPFKKLPFVLVKEADVSIVPMGLSGLFHLKSKNSWLIRPTTLKIKFGDPIPLKTVRESDPVQLRDYTRDRILKLIEKP